MVKLTEMTLNYPRLPEYLEGMRILHFGDLHTRGWGRAEQRLHEIMQEGCDLLVCTGDSCYQRSFSPVENKQGEAMEKWSLTWRGLILPPETDKAVEVWRSLLAGFFCRLGVYMVQGNHDSPTFIEQVRELGVTVLANQCRLAELPDGGRVNICGVQGLGRRSADMVETLAHAQGDWFTIAVCHYPEMAEALAAGGADLILAGHTHGGQICLPNGRPIVTHNQTGRYYLTGLATLGDSYLYTTRGLGTTFLPLRLFCPPEVVRFTLRRG